MVEYKCGEQARPFQLDALCPVELQGYRRHLLKLLITGDGDC